MCAAVCAAVVCAAVCVVLLLKCVVLLAPASILKSCLQFVSEKSVTYTGNNVCQIFKQSRISIRNKLHLPQEKRDRQKTLK